nr:VWA domain-containing protein [Deinobacterium chartae]
MLLEPELIEAVQPDVRLAATLVSLKNAMPAKAKETARIVVRRVVEDLERRLAEPLRSAVRGSLNRAARNLRPRAAEMDWNRTIRANLKHYQHDRRTVIPERLIGFGRKQAALRDIVLLLDQSGSMATSVVYAGVFAAVLASLRSVSTRLIAFDTEVVDLTDQSDDPVDLLFGVQLGGGTDINRALSYAQSVVSRPEETVMVLISDLFEGGNAREMVARAAALVGAGVRMVVLLALSDEGSPAYDPKLAAELAALGIPSFACTPDLFPELMAAALQKQDLAQWAASRDLVTRGATG